MEKRIKVWINTGYPAAKPLEKDIQKRCKSILESFGWRVERRNTGAMQGEYKGKSRFVRFGEKGASDLPGWIIGNGRHFECEVKRHGEHPRLDQVEWLLKAHREGVVAFWVSSPEELARVVMHVNRGGSIKYLETKRIYSVQVKGVRGTIRAEGPSGDYELV